MNEESVVALPAPRLRPFIDSYIGYKVAGRPPGVHRGLPSRHLTLIVSIGEPITVLAQTDPGQPPGMYGFVVGGLQASPALVAAGGDEEGIAIELTPLGCRAVLGLPTAALWNTSLEAQEVMGRAAGELQERLRELDSWADRFAACDDVLGRHLRERAPAAELTAAWLLLVASGGTMPIGAVAEEVGWSRRNLNLRFTDEFGLSPKLAARVIRFDTARWMLQSPRRPTLAEVAAACGFYDQPHLNRDFVDLAGCPPGQWLASEFPSVQDGKGRERARSTA